MNNKTTLMLAIVGCLTITQLGYASGRDTVVKTILNCVGYVVGGCVTGDITMGAAGDKEDINTEGLEVTNFGVVKGPKPIEKDITLPASGKKVFKFTPTTGQYANKQISVLFYTLDLTQPFPADAPKGLVKEGEKAKTGPDAKDHNTITGVYRQVAGETQWTEFMVRISDDTVEHLKNPTAPIKLRIFNSGMVIAQPPSFKYKGQLTKPDPIKVELGKEPSAAPAA